MQEVTQYPANTFSWIDLATTDYQEATKFYTALFGWTAEEIPIESDDTVYVMLTYNGLSVAALYPQDEQQKAQNLPPFWVSYVTVDNVDTTAKAVTELGGQIIAPPFDVLDSGRMALLQDPTGAMLALWQPKKSIGAQLVNMPNTLVWNELMTHDTNAATKFYSNLFNWKANVNDMPNGTQYTAFINTINDRYVGGMMAMPDHLTDVPSSWGIYFMVEDCDATVKRVEELGGKTVLPARDIPGMGRFAVVQDPQGGIFSVMYVSKVDPPPGY